MSYPLNERQKILVVIVGNDPTFEAYETPAYPSMLYHHIEALSNASLEGDRPLKLSYLQILGFFFRFDLYQECFYMVPRPGLEPR